MNVAALVPAPNGNAAFRRDKLRFVPAESGCYALTTFSKEVLYVGLAKNLRRRFDQHLDSNEKTAVTKLGRAVIFFWLQTDEVSKVERTWMNIHLQAEGRLPLLNSVFSPTFV